MDRLSATSRYFCRCGSETHVFMEGYQGSNARRTAIACWRCDHVIGFADAARLWTASTPQGARQKRLQAQHRATSERAASDARPRPSA